MPCFSSTWSAAVESFCANPATGVADFFDGSGFDDSRTFLAFGALTERPTTSSAANTAASPPKSAILELKTLSVAVGVTAFVGGGGVAHWTVRAASARRATKSTDRMADPLDAVESASSAGMLASRVSSLTTSMRMLRWRRIGSSAVGSVALPWSNPSDTNRIWRFVGVRRSNWSAARLMPSYMGGVSPSIFIAEIEAMAPSLSRERSRITVGNCP